MAGVIGEVPREAAKATAWTAMAGGRLVRSMGEGLMHRIQPGYVPPEVVARQAVLKRFEGRFSIAPNLLDSSSDRQLDVRARMAADAMVEGGLVQEHGLAEIRPIVPEDVFEDRVLGERRERAVELLGLALEEDYNVQVIPATHPIVPSRHARTRIDAATAWEAITPEMDGLAHQFRGDRQYGRPALAALTGFGYEGMMFGGGDVRIKGTPRGNKLLALEEVGERPDGNVLAWTGPPLALAA